MVYEVLRHKELHLMSFCWFDIIMTLNPYHPKSKIAAIAFLNTIFTTLIVLLFKRFLELEQYNNFILYVSVKLWPWIPEI